MESRLRSPTRKISAATLAVFTETTGMPSWPDARQDVVLAGEAHLGGAVADIDLVVGRLQQALADTRGQALPQHDGVALAVLKAVDAELLLLHGDGGVGRARNGDIGREIDLAARQRIGELEADARRGSIRIDLVVGDAEAVLLPQRLVGARGCSGCRREARLAR